MFIIYIPSNSSSDILVCGLTSDGAYSVKSSARLAQGDYNFHEEDVKFKWIWMLDVSLKIKNFL